jgi:hypothetical protein
MDFYLSLSCGLFHGWCVLMHALNSLLPACDVTVFGCEWWLATVLL